jgi:hypothetical protein
MFEELRKIIGVMSINELKISWAFKTPDNFREDVLPRAQVHVAKIKEYLQAHNLSFEETNKDVSACCNHSNSHLSILRIPIQMHDGDLVYINTVTSDTPIYRLSVRAYMDGFGPEEEKLQKKLTQDRIDADNIDGIAEHLHSSSPFRLFSSEEKARQTIDHELFSNLQETQEQGSPFNEKRIPFECAYIIGHEDPYRWPKDFPLEGLKETNYNNICSVGMVAFPIIHRVHSDGTTIVASETDIPYLEDIFNPEKGFLSSIIKTLGPYYNQHFMYVCDSCEPKVLLQFRNNLVKRINKYNGWGLDIKPHSDVHGNPIKYSPNLEKLVVKIVSKENIFSSWDFMHNW